MAKIYTQVSLTILVFCLAILAVQTSVASVYTENTSVYNESYIDGTDVSIYPNPVKAFATVNFSKNIDRIVILNIVGKEILSIIPEQGKQVISVNLSDLQPGVYFIAGMSNGTKLITKRFMKEI
ncbi:MAG TPA: T9SS type A sorting domain-containing protein [Chitinophagales bacterium]|nr:T9SS type A sorting domain-containing protein [Chitinophagales bacterium]